jgi:ribonucleoside-triphosphate reductase
MIDQTRNCEPSGILQGGAMEPSIVLIRKGACIPFEIRKTLVAINNSFVVMGEFPAGYSEYLALEAREALASNGQATPVSIETLQDAVERVLIANGHLGTAHAFSIYCDSHHRLRLDEGFALSNNPYRSKN